MARKTKAQVQADDRKRKDMANEKQRAYRKRKKDEREAAKRAPPVSLKESNIGKVPQTGVLSAGTVRSMTMPERAGLGAALPHPLIAPPPSDQVQQSMEKLMKVFAADSNGQRAARMKMLEMATSIPSSRIENDQKVLAYAVEHTLPISVTPAAAPKKRGWWAAMWGL